MSTLQQTLQPAQSSLARDKEASGPALPTTTPKAPVPASSIGTPSIPSTPAAPKAPRLVLLPTRRIGYDVRARISNALVQARARVSNWMVGEGLSPPSRTRSLSAGRRVCGTMHVQQDADLGLDTLDTHPYQLLVAAGRPGKQELADMEMTVEQSYRETVGGPGVASR